MDFIGPSVGTIVIFATVFVALAFLFIVAIGNRTDTDPGGSRPMAAYLYSAGFLFLWIAYAGLAFALESLIRAIGNHNISFGGVTYPGPSSTNTVIRACVLGGIVVVFAGGAWLAHLRRGNALANTEADLSGPTRRIMRTYVALVCFLAVVAAVLAIMVALWMVCGLFSPTIFFGNPNHTEQVRSICEVLVIVVLAGAIFAYHQRFAPDHLRLFPTGHDGRHTRAREVTPPITPVSAAPARPPAPPSPPPTES
jgi:hypothetical protein